MRRTTFTIVLLLCCLSGCASAPPPPAANGGLTRQQNEGYSLLYKLMDDESGVGQIFIIKHADDSLGNLVRSISKTCDAAKKKLDDFHKADNRLEFDVADLPAIEQRGRDLQRSDETHALLGSSGQEFEVRLIFTQAEAMNYAVQLSRALAEKEDDPTRKAFLNDLAKQCAGYHDQLMKMLAFAGGK